MELFLNEIFSFPVVIFTFPLLILMLFWLLAILSMVDLEILDFELDTDADSDGEAAGSFLEKLGLEGVPLTVALTLVDGYAFVFTYLMRKYLTPLFDGILSATAAGAVMAVFAVVIALPLSALCIKPLRRFFQTHEAIGKDELIGRICVVTTQTVTASFGQATSEDGMVLSVRANEPNDIKKGSKVVLLAFNSQQDAYSVASEAELVAMSSSSQPLNNFSD